MARVSRFAAVAAVYLMPASVIAQMPFRILLINRSAASAFANSRPDPGGSPAAISNIAESPPIDLAKFSQSLPDDEDGVARYSFLRIDAHLDSA